MTEAESREIVDSIKEIIEKEHTMAASAAAPPSSSVVITVLENPKEIMDRAIYRQQRILISFQFVQHLVGCKWLKILFLTLLYRF
jgi:hypothetical protein